jgi:hypothetical protein
MSKVMVISYLVNRWEDATAQPSRALSVESHGQGDKPAIDLKTL